jgi:hypothetical protein
MPPRRALTTCFLAVWAAAVAVSVSIPASRGDAPSGSQTLPAAAPSPAGEPRLIIDGVPDTGQFLPDTAVILQVGDQVATVRDYIDTYFASDPELRPKSDSLGRVAFLNTLIDKGIMDLVVRRANRPLTFEDRQLLREREAQVLSNVLYVRTVVDSVTITQEDIARVHRDFGYEIRLRHILFEDQFNAQQVRDSLIKGRISWHEAHARYSRALSDSGPDGDIGRRSPLALEPLLAAHLFGLSEGAFSDPWDDDQGIHLYQVVKRRVVKPPDIQFVRGSLQRQARAQQMQRRIEAILAQLRADAAMAYDTANMIWAVRRYVESPSGFARPAPADKERVMARTRDGAYTLESLVSFYQQTSPLLQTRLNTFNRLRSELDAAVLEPYKVALARRRGLDRDPLTIVLMERRRMEIQAEHLYQDSIDSRITISPKERRKYFDEHLSRRMSEAKIRHALFIRTTAEGADSVVVRLLAGEPPQEILSADSLQGARRGRIFDVLESEDPPYKKMLWEEMKEGKVGVYGPLPESGRYYVIQHLGMDPGHLLSYQELEPLADESVRNLKADKLTRAFFNRHRRGVPIVARPELVMRIRLIASEF